MRCPRCIICPSAALTDNHYGTVNNYRNQPFKAEWLLYVPPAFTLENPTLSQSNSPFMCYTARKSELLTASNNPVSIPTVYTTQTGNVSQYELP